MLRRSEKNWMEHEDEAPKGFLDESPDNTAAQAATELRERVTKVEQQVLAQYTATAAYATLAQQGVETARAEARADLDRTQATIIGLLDRLRTELGNRIDGIEGRPSLPSTSSPRPTTIRSRSSTVSAAVSSRAIALRSASRRATASFSRSAASSAC